MRNRPVRKGFQPRVNRLIGALHAVDASPNQEAPFVCVIR